jgi:hypothetical protein
MNLSLKELNELIYCVGVVIADDHNGYGHEERIQLFNKLYAELEERVKEMDYDLSDIVDPETGIPYTDYEIDNLRDLEEGSLGQFS